MTNELENNRLVASMSSLRKAGKKALLPFVTAGYPSLEHTLAILKELDRLGVAGCELGIPFSDPIADGPIIQASYTEALETGIHSQGILEMVRRFRDQGGKLPLIAMVSYSIVYRHGPANFVAEAASAGIDGLIVPDLPLEEAGPMERICREQNLALVLLIAPTTPPQRQVEIARHSRGFIYFISVAGITGERTKLPPATIEAVAELRKQTHTPVCVGFGVSSPEIVSQVCQSADGAIVGSAIVHRISDHKTDPPDRLAMLVGGFVSSLLEPIR